MLTAMQLRLLVTLQAWPVQPVLLVQQQVPLLWGWAQGAQAVAT